MARTKVAFLYTELAGYFMACVGELAKNADVLVVRWPVNKEAPFVFNTSGEVKIIDRKSCSDDELQQIVTSFNPDVLVCSGWIDKGYLKVARSFRKRIPIVVSLDNHWNGSIKQYIATVLSRVTLKRIFTHAWVPGEPQAVYARKLGFSRALLFNFYCADTDLFDGIYQRTNPAKAMKIPHRFLYVARYVEHKGIFEMWRAFQKFKSEVESDWELWCIGTGDQWEQRMESPGIRHIGFVQPSELERYVAETGVYVLPSKFEPWGVSVQEFAICGFPLLVSDAVGSSSKFVGDNGIIFPAGSEEAILNAFKKIASMSDTELLEMGAKSHNRGMALNVKIWAENLLKLAKK